jgi:uncharacterized coiled-coil DUF342 family protein
MIRKNALLFTEREYQLAMQIVNLQEALDIANMALKENGKLGVLADLDSRPSFRKGRTFHAKVRKLLK